MPRQTVRGSLSVPALPGTLSEPVHTDMLNHFLVTRQKKHDDACGSGLDLVGDCVGASGCQGREVWTKARV
eukprot:1505989-Rhodomonas_salina.2